MDRPWWIPIVLMVPAVIYWSVRLLRRFVRSRPPMPVGPFYRYGAKNSAGEIVTVYPSLAACLNDPLWRNPRGHYSVAWKEGLAGNRITEPTRIYSEDLRAIRRED